MGRRTVEIQILDHQYQLTQLSATKGRGVLGVLTKVLGKAAGGLGGMDVEGSALGAGLGAILESLDEATLKNLCDAFGPESRVLNDAGNWPALQGPVFDDHFAGNYGEMTLWLIECLKLNFADFLDAKKREMIAAHLGLKASKSPSPMGSTGTSGES